METLTIEPPKGHEVDFDQNTSTIKFKEKPKNVIERIKTIDDVLADHGISQETLDQEFKHVPDHLKHPFIIEMMVESLNEGGQPAWEISSGCKYVPWFKMGSSGFRFYDCDFWYTGSYVGSRLCFKSRELAEYAGKQFVEVYKQFMIIN